MPSSLPPISNILSLNSCSSKADDEKKRKKQSSEQARKNKNLLTTLELAKSIASLSDFRSNSSFEDSMSESEEKLVNNDYNMSDDRSKPLKKRPKRDLPHCHGVDHGVPVGNKKNDRSFPVLIRDILDDETNASVITWLPHGKGFKIVNRQKFIKQFTPDPWKRYSVFTKDLVKWNFVLIERGRDSGSFYNELFQRDQPELQETMKFCESKRVCILAPRIPKETTLRKKSMPLTNEQMMETILRKKRSSLDLAKVRLKNSLAYSQDQSQQQQQQLGSHRQGQNTFTTMPGSSNMSLSELSQPQDKMTQQIVSAAVRALACFEKAGPSNGGSSNIACDTNTENKQKSDNTSPITSSNTRLSPTFGPLSCSTGTLNLNPNATSHATSTNTTASARPFQRPPPFKMPNTNLIGTARKISGMSLGFNGVGNGHQVPLGELLAQCQKERQVSLSLSTSFAGASNYTNEGIMQYIRSRSMKHILLTAPAVPSEGGINSNNMMDHTPSNMDFGK